MVACLPTSLVVTDSMQRVLGRNEEISTRIRNSYREFVVPLRRHNVSVLRLDHLGKDTTRGPRASSAKLDDVDVSDQLLPRKGNVLQLTTTHSRYPDVHRKLIARLSDPLRHELSVGQDMSEDVQSASETPRRQGLPVPALMAALDNLALPSSAGRPTCAKALKAAGLKYRTEELAEAVKLRKGVPQP